MTTEERSELSEVLRAGWSEHDLAQFARWHTNRPFFAINRRQLLAIINSALYGDYFARQFLKERQSRPVGPHGRVFN